MNLDQINTWRNRAGRAGALLSAILVLAILDGLVANIRQPVNLLRMLPGESAAVDGPLREKPNGIDELSYTSGSDLLRIDFVTLHPGYWMGGAMWRGLLTTQPLIQPGEYEIGVYLKAAPDKPLSVFKVRIYKDLRSEHLDSDSFLLRYLDISPLWTAICLFGVLLLNLGVVYLLSGARDRLLAQEGKAEVYHIIRKELECEVAFGLGAANGIRAGDRLTLLDKSGVAVCRVEVKAVSDTDAIGTIGIECDVQQGYLIRKD